MSLEIRDGNNVAAFMKSRLDGGEHILAKDVEQVRAAASFAVVRVTLDTTAGGILIRASDTKRRRIKIRNLSDTPFFINGAGVTAANGYPIPGSNGYMEEFLVTGELRGITSVGTADIAAFVEIDSP